MPRKAPTALGASTGRAYHASADRKAIRDDVQEAADTRPKREKEQRRDDSRRPREYPGRQISEGVPGVQKAAPFGWSE